MDVFTHCNKRLITYDHFWVCKVANIFYLRKTSGSYNQSTLLKQKFSELKSAGYRDVQTGMTWYYMLCITLSVTT